VEIVKIDITNIGTFGNVLYDIWIVKFKETISWIT